MKVSQIALGVVAALSVNTGIFAQETEGFEFHGYFRTGVITSAENDFKRANYAGQKETLGRLGIEADNDYKANFASTWVFEDERSFKIHFGIGKSGKESALTSSSDAIDAGITNAFIELNGITPSGTFWAGRREYGKADNYIFMTDFFYTDMSGTGIGIQGYELGDSIVDLAYIGSDRVNEDVDRWATSPAAVGNNATNLNNLMHALNISSTFGNLKLSALLKAMPDNWDTTGKEWAETGYDLTATYNLSSFFAIPGNGFSKIIVQGGKGLGAGNLLGGTITDYNAYHPGSLAQGQHNDWGAAGEASYLLTQLEDDDTSARILMWGGYTFDNGVSLFPSIQAQYNDMATGSARTDGGYNYWASAMVRPTIPVSQHFYLQGEAGYVYNNWNGNSWKQTKYTVAPTFILPTSLGVAPEVRLLATYLPESWTSKDSKGDAASDFIVGFQADVWW
ncbi:carbohydrate porin [Vibrio methylphosphonaticus]|uniref:carbohydrate porin n=1 Tax=Vibrio methylphosphonaticus TaxID=2946866 RepID=UPI002029DA39|nr:carbohydrate porin [Vibrio methylphosphonaticus]MCL9774101.1 carbohydrate porin [Vibrio methylphosphonaticus]